MEQPEESIHQRIAALIEAKEQGNKSSFARRVGAAPGVIGDILGGRKNKPGFDLLQKIALAYNDVNTSWLLLGGGEMFLPNSSTRQTANVTAPKNKGHVQTNTGNHNTITNNVMLEECRRDLASAQKEVEMLWTLVASRDALIESKDALIAAKEEVLTLLRGGHNRPN